jgi:hypothetical protein
MDVSPVEQRRVSDNGDRFSTPPFSPLSSSLFRYAPGYTMEREAPALRAVGFQ